MSRAISATSPAQGTQINSKVQENANPNAFKDLLSEKLNQANNTSTIEFSKHAQQRVQERGITVNEGLLASLSESVVKAEEKGATNILAMNSQSAFIINVQSNRVITAMTQSEMKQNIFTNIDGAVIL